MPVRTTVEPLEQNKVKLHIEVDASDFDRLVDDAFRKLAADARIPGFRKGKVPRRILEARIGADAVRSDTLKGAIPGYLAEAITSENIDAVSLPELENVSSDPGQNVRFDAVFQVRPKVDLGDWRSIVVTIADPEPTDQEIQDQLDTVREQFAGLEEVGRPAAVGDFVTIDIRGYIHSDEVPGTTASDFSYELGSGSFVPKLDTELVGARPGAIFKFTDTLPESFDEQAGRDVAFQVLVKEVQARKLPEVTDEWVSDVSEFESVDELRADLAGQVRRVKVLTTYVAATSGAISALTKQVPDDDVSEALVAGEMEHALQHFFENLRARGRTIEDYFATTGDTQEALLDRVKAQANREVKTDLAIRALIAENAILASEDEVTAELERALASIPDPDARDGLDSHDNDGNDHDHSSETDRRRRVVRNSLNRRAAVELAMGSIELRTEAGDKIGWADLKAQHKAIADETDPSADNETDPSADDATGETEAVADHIQEREHDNKEDASHG